MPAAFEGFWVYVAAPFEGFTFLCLRRFYGCAVYRYAVSMADAVLMPAAVQWAIPVSGLRVQQFKVQNVALCSELKVADCH